MQVGEGSLVAQLHKAAFEGSADGIRQLVRQGVHVRSHDHYGLTALHWAATAGHTRVVSVLYELGADVGARDRAERTAFDLAFANGHEETANVLLDMSTKPPKPSEVRPCTLRL